MPSFHAHLAKARHNEDFFLSFGLDKTPYLDWVVSGVFYVALHCIDAYLAQKNKHPNIHKDRNNNIKYDQYLHKIFPAYRQLKDDSEGARYKMQTFTPNEIRNDIIPQLDSIKNFLRKFVPQIP